MDSVTEWLGPIPLEAWGLLLFGVVVGAAVPSFGHIRRAFYQWRLDRRLARDPYILREEMDAYRLALGEDLEPLDVRKIVGGAVLDGLLLGGAAWFASAHLEDWWQAFLLAIGAFSLLHAWWRRLNDPEVQPFTLPAAHFPREAVLGFVAAIGIVALLLLAATLFF